MERQHKKTIAYESLTDHEHQVIGSKQGALIWKNNQFYLIADSIALANK